MKETRKIEIELSNKTRQTAECTISKFCEESPIATVRVKYSYQLPITHSIFEYYKNAHHDEYRHVIDEILERGAKAIIVHKLDILTNVSVYALESTLTNGQFLSKFKLDLNDSTFMQVGYITNDGIEHVEPTVLNAGLEYIINRYALSVYNDIIPMSRFEQSDYYTRKIRLVKE